MVQIREEWYRVERCVRSLQVSGMCDVAVQRGSTGLQVDKKMFGVEV